MGRIKDQRVVATHTVNGRVFEVERIIWTYTDGLSFDVRDVDTGQCLTAESYDDQPDADTIAELLDQLRSDRGSGGLDHFFDGCDAELEAILGAEGAGDVVCEGCRSRVDPDLWVDHVRDCDRVDGAGHKL